MELLCPFHLNLLTFSDQNLSYEEITRVRSWISGQLHIILLYSLRIFHTTTKLLVCCLSSSLLQHVNEAIKEEYLRRVFLSVQNSSELEDIQPSIGLFLCQCVTVSSPITDLIKREYYKQANQKQVGFKTSIKFKEVKSYRKLIYVLVCVCVCVCDKHFCVF